MLFASRRCTLVTVLEILSRKGVTFCVLHMLDVSLSPKGVTEDEGCDN
jgi:hypothetical protein